MFFTVCTAADWHAWAVLSNMLYLPLFCALFDSNGAHTRLLFVRSTVERARARGKCAIDAGDSLSNRPRIFPAAINKCVICGRPFEVPLHARMREEGDSSRILAFYSLFSTAETESKRSPCSGRVAIKRHFSGRRAAHHVASFFPAAIHHLTLISN